MQPSEETRIQDSLEICAECDYDGGFHVLLERREDAPWSNMRIHLKCPSCGKTYDVGWVGRLDE
jgi:hypothetical protein